MANPVWPASLPQTPLSNGYTSELMDNVLRSKPDTGPAITRRRFSGVPDVLSCQMVLDNTQYDTFMTFYKTGTLSGSLKFDWIHPEEGVATVECRFLGKVVRSKAGGDWRVSFKVEVLP